MDFCRDKYIPMELTYLELVAKILIPIDVITWTVKPFPITREATGGSYICNIILFCYK